MKDLTIENITENVHIVNSKCEDARLRFLFERLVAHLHNFARETRLSTKEWMTAIEFLTASGKICSDTRQEFILLSDVLGLSILVDSMDQPKPAGSTEGTVLGPFHVAEAEHEELGSQISHDPNGEPLLVVCSIKDTAGRPLLQVSVDVWETDSKGFYDVQHADREGFDGRAAIVPVPYPIPDDGPVGTLLKALKRHPWRPSGFDQLITALYLRGDPYETTMPSSAFQTSKATQRSMMYQVIRKLLRYDFVLVTEKETNELRDAEALAAGNSLGMDLRLEHGVLVRSLNPL
ncbi:Intradiol ring-cleavage dioxygenase [Nemania abortiva]|nr:Intradiol ring-cleavage dioxygenase [Nemania abortiva]